MPLFGIVHSNTANNRRFSEKILCGPIIDPHFSNISPPPPPPLTSFPNTNKENAVSPTLTFASVILSSASRCFCSFEVVFRLSLRRHLRQYPLLTDVRSRYHRPNGDTADKLLGTFFCQFHISTTSLFIVVTDLFIVSYRFKDSISIENLLTAIIASINVDTYRH